MHFIFAVPTVSLQRKSNSSELQQNKNALHMVVADWWMMLRGDVKKRCHNTMHSWSYASEKVIVELCSRERNRDPLFIFL